MSKTETLRQSAAALNKRRLEYSASQTELLRQAKLRSAEELAETLEPLAQAMAALTDETRQTLTEIDRESRAHAETYTQKIKEFTRALNSIVAETKKAAHSLHEASGRMEWRHYAIAALTGAFTAVLVSAFWLWLAPPKIVNQIQLDPQAVAEHLKPALTGQRRPSKGK